MTSRNASYTLFGWDFQVNAAIFIFLKNLKVIDKVRLEGKLQDIEFVKKDKSKIFAQAKSIYRYDDYKNVIANLKSAVQSLDEAQEKDPLCNEVIYVTNTPNPFKKDKGFFGGVTKTNYDGLPNSCKAIVDSIITESSLTSLNTQQFSIQVIPCGKEVKKEKVEKMMNILERDFPHNQVIIASIFQYDIENLHIHTLEKSLMGEDF